jgi:hypothetical protein
MTSTVDGGGALTFTPSPSVGGCWPTAAQTMLLRASVLEADAGLTAWSDWRRDHTLEEADHVAISLFPLVYRNLGSRLPGPDHGRLKGAYRVAWLRNQLFFKRTVPALRALEEAGVTTMMLKGAALAVASYRDTGARPMEDVDVLVPWRDADRALAALTAAGWTTDPRGRLRSEHAQSLNDRSGQPLDLHWFSLAQSGSDNGFWARSVPAEILGVPTRALCPTDQLLHVAAHGGEWGAIPPVRWMADAVAIERSSRPEGLDWDTFASEAIERRMTVLLAAALEHLAATVEFPVPLSVLERLHAAPKGRLEHRIHRAVTRPNGGGNWWLVELERFRRRARLDPSLRTSDFLKDHFGVATRKGLVAPVARKAAQVAYSQTAGRLRAKYPGNARP